MTDRAAAIIDIVTSELAKNKEIYIGHNGTQIFVTSGQNYDGLTKNEYYKKKELLTVDNVADLLGLPNADAVTQLNYRAKNSHPALRIPVGKHADAHVYRYSAIMKWQERMEAAEVGTSDQELTDMLKIHQGLMLPAIRKP